MDKIKVILNAAVTYLVLAATILGIFADELGKVGGLPEWVVTSIVALISAITVAILIIRRVEPVIEARRGILEPRPPLDGLVPGQVYAARKDRGESLVGIVILVCVIFIAVVVALRVV